MLHYENIAWQQSAKYVVGCDEVGRGCIAGPVVASAVSIHLDDIEFLTDLNDSKQLSEKKRVQFFEKILLYGDVGIGILQADIIDKINIYEASRQAMLIAIKNLPKKADYVLTDAMPMPSLNIPVESIIKGDQKSLSIAAASIVAKCIRDEIMRQYGNKYLGYGFEKHKGYGTKQHLEQLNTLGIIEKLHRQSFAPVAELLIKQETLF
jgi:Ribonuclease HII